MSVKHESVLLLAKMGNYGFSLWQVLWQALFMVKCRGSNIYCTALHCTVLYCTVRHCTALYC